MQLDWQRTAMLVGLEPSIDTGGRVMAGEWRWRASPPMHILYLIRYGFGREGAAGLQIGMKKPLG
jgi:hypothetical protein